MAFACARDAFIARCRITGLPAGSAMARALFCALPVAAKFSARAGMIGSACNTGSSDAEQSITAFSICTAQALESVVCKAAKICFIGVAGIIAGGTMLHAARDTFKVAAEIDSSAARLDCRIAGLAVTRDAIFVFALAVIGAQAFDTGFTVAELTYTAGAVCSAHAAGSVLACNALV